MQHFQAVARRRIFRKARQSSDGEYGQCVSGRDRQPALASGFALPSTKHTSFPIRNGFDLLGILDFDGCSLVAVWFQSPSLVAI